MKYLTWQHPSPNKNADAALFVFKNYDILNKKLGK